MIQGKVRAVALCALLALCALVRPAGAQQPAAGLAPGDVVRVEIWREKDLSGDFIVNGDGVVTLPMIGDQRVTGLTVDELRARLVERFRVNLRNPSITVTPLRRVQVLGEVNKPGLYPLDPTVTLGGAIAVAEGATTQGDLRNIRIVRGGQVLRERVAAGETLSGAEIRSGDQIFVGQRSWVSRNSGLLLGALLSGVTSVVAGLIIAGR